MDEKKLSELRSKFVHKPTPELRRIVENADTGDWTEEAVVAAREIFSNRPDAKDDDGIEKTEQDGLRTALCANCGERVRTFKRQLIIDLCPNCIRAAAAERAALSDAPSGTSAVKGGRSVWLIVCGVLLLAFFVFLVAGQFREKPPVNAKRGSAIDPVDTLSRTPIATFNHQGPVYEAEVLGDGKRILTRSADGTARIWPISGGQAVATFEHDKPVNGAKVLSDGQQVLTWSDDGTARIWPITGGEAIAISEHPGPVHGAEVLADGKQILTWGGYLPNSREEGAAKIWSIEGGEAIATFRHDDWVWSANVLSDGNQVLTRSQDGTARIWPIAGGKATAVFRHDDWVMGATLLGDREQLLTWSTDGTARIWSLDRK